MKYRKKVALTLPAVDEIHFWQFSLSEAAPRFEAFNRTLSDSELARAALYATPLLAMRYVCGRGILRELLACYLGLAANQVVFEFGPRGKPRVAGGRKFFFNVSHSEDRYVAVFSSVDELGVDIERTGRCLSPEDWKNQMFSPEEQAMLANLPEGECSEEFLRLWTFKEACAKALGEGVYAPLANFGFEHLPTGFGAIRVRCEGYTGALVARGGGWRVRDFTSSALWP